MTEKLLTGTLSLNTTNQPTAILDLHLTLTLSVTSPNVRSERLNTQKPFYEETERTRHGITVLAGRSNLNTLLDQQI